MFAIGVIPYLESHVGGLDRRTVIIWQVTAIIVWAIVVTALSARWPH